MPNDPVGYQNHPLYSTGGVNPTRKIGSKSDLDSSVGLWISIAWTGKTWLIFVPKEAQTIQYTLLGAAKRSPKESIAEFGFLWATNQLGFSTQAANTHHPIELSRLELEHIFHAGGTPPVMGEAVEKYAPPIQA